MNILRSIKNKKLRIAIPGFIALIIIYAFLHFFVFTTDPFLALLGFLNDCYLNASVITAKFLFHLTGPLPAPENHSLVYDSNLWPFFVPEVRYKKIVFLILLIIWIVKTPIYVRLTYTLLLASVHFFSLTLFNIYGLGLTPASDYPIILSIPDTLAFILFVACLHLWYHNHKKNALSAISKIKLDPRAFESKIEPLFIIIYLYIFLDNFVFDLFQFYPWINIIFTSSQKILALFGYDSVVDTVYLIGDNGTIYMAKYCLGLKTMFLFASVVYLTGTKSKTKWIYIFSGLIFLNIVNILRFVFLFIHVQKNGDYTLTMDLHDLYNLVIYSTVFILWIIWFEKFSDMKIRESTSGQESKPDL